MDPKNKLGAMPVRPLLYTMAVPLMLSLLIQSLYNIVDSIFVARLSETALTAASLVYAIQFLMIAIGVGAAVGLNALLSRKLGQKKPEEACRAATTGLFLMLGTSLVFTLVGTVFGGIWGNESWGRFWGWDPKENGALMIVLWQLTVLHVRKAGWLSSWLLHFSNVVGGVIIAFAWWGVNMLGVGLHSYGFTSGRDALDMFYWFEAVLCVLFIILHYRVLRRVDVR